MSRLRRLQSAATAIAFVCGALGLLAGTGCRVVPAGPTVLAWPVHLVLLAVGAAAGWATLLRSREIDRRRWDILRDPHLTSGEREYAHKEAERQRTWAGTSFLAAPTVLGYWVAHQLRGDGAAVADLLPLTPMLGFGLGLLAARLRHEGTPDGEH